MPAALQRIPAPAEVTITPVMVIMTITLTARPTVPEGTIYTCPMHPQIRQIGPGSCPICGMALEPEVASLDAPPNPELADMTRRFWIGLALSLPAVVLEMGGHLAGGHGLIDQTLSNWIQLVFATPVVLWAGWPFFVRGWQSLVTRNLNMFTLIAMGTGVAYVYSLVGTVAPNIFPATFRGHDGAVAVYFEAAAVITVLVLLGQVLELRAREATSGAIKALLELAPKTARLVDEDGADHEVPIDSLKVGDRLRVRPGEKVPVDGVILEGRSTLDESLVTGESMPVTKETGAKVIAGTLNQSGGFVMRADKVGRDTLLSQIVNMVADAQRSRAPIQRLADQVAGWFVPAVIVIAVVAFGAWALFGPEPRMAYGLVAAVNVLIIACPCALGLATPMSIMVGVGRGAQAGVLIKNAEALERMEKVDTLVVDKTGTLTEGKPKVVAIVAASGFQESEILRLAASVERASEHPLADAIVRAAKERNLDLSKVEEFEFADRQGRHRQGRRQDRCSRQFELPGVCSVSIPGRSTNEAERLREDGATVINIAVDGKLAGLFAIADPIKAVDAGGAKGAGGRRHQGHHADRRQPDHGQRRRTKARDHRCRGGSASGSEDCRGRQAAEGRADRRHGRRRRQRRPGACRGRCRHRHGNRHRRRDGERRHHPAERRSRRHRSRAAAVAGNHAQHPAEPVLRVRLQRRRHPDCRRHPLSEFRHPAVADHCRRRHGAVVGERRRQRIAIARDAAVAPSPPDVRRPRRKSCQAIPARASPP